MASDKVQKMEVPQDVSDAATSSSSASSSSKRESNKKSLFEVNSRPICLIVLGMAGSGKTSFVERLTQLGSMQNMKPYVINLDPACQNTPYHANIGEINLNATKRFKLIKHIYL